MSEPKNPDALNVAGSERPVVPVYTCVVYVCKNDDGTYKARVANLSGIESVGASERDVLGKVCREFKARINAVHEEGVAMSLIDPPIARQEQEQVRSIPVHL